LQFIQHEAGDKQRSGEEAGAGYVRDAPINDHTGIKKDRTALRPGGPGIALFIRRFATADTGDEAKDILLAHPENGDAKVGKEYRPDEWQNAAKWIWQQRKREGQQCRYNQSHDQANERGEKRLSGGFSEGVADRPGWAGSEVGGKDQPKQCTEQTE